MKLFTPALALTAVIWFFGVGAAPAQAKNIKLFFKNETAGEYTYRFSDAQCQVTGKGTIVSKNRNSNALETGLIPEGWYTVEIWSGSTRIFRETLYLNTNRTFTIYYGKKGYWFDYANPRPSYLNDKDSYLNSKSSRRAKYYYDDEGDD